MRNCPVKVFLTVLAIWAMPALLCVAQQFPFGLPEVKNFTSKDYQWHPKNFQITQGSNGLMYIGNTYGVLEYDGKIWRKIMLPHGLDGHCLAVDQQGQVLVGALNEFGKLKPDTKGITPFYSLAPSPNLSGSAIGEINQIWPFDDKIILSTDHAIYQFDNDSLSILRENSPSTSFTKVIGNFLFIHKEGNLVRIDLNRMQTEKSFVLKTDLADLIPTRQDTLAILPGGSFFSLSSGEIRKPKELPAGFIVHKVIRLASGHFALASQHRGLAILDSQLNLIHHIDSNHGLSSDKLYDVFEDKERNLWVALDNGISHITLNTPFTHYGRTNGIRGMGYTSAYFRNKLFLGTSQGVFSHDREGEFDLIKGSEGQVYELQNIDSQLFVAHESGLYLLDNGQLELLSTAQKVWTISEVPNQKNLLIAGTEHGLFLIKNSGNGWKTSENLFGFDESSRIIVFDSDQQLWVCHGNKGLFRLSIDYKNLEIRTVEFYSQNNGKLPVYISFVSPSKNGLLFSSENGVYQFDQSTKTFNPYNEINSFLEHNFYVDKIIEGTFENLWIMQDNKITKLDPLDNGSYTLLPENVITELNGNLVGSYEYLHVYDSNNVIIGTQEGFAHFNVNANINYRLDSEKNKNTTMIRGVKFESADSSFLASTSIESSILLDHKFNNITFTYAAGYYQSREQIKFSFYLENQNDDREPTWSEWHGSNQNSFKNLAPGDYVFHVRSRGDLFKNSEIASYPFVIQSPWYATRLSAIIYTVCLMFIGLSIYKIRVAKIKKDKKEALLQKDEELRQQKLISESEKVKLINERLKEKVVLKNKELGSVALEITKKNEFLSQLKKNLSQLSPVASNEVTGKLKRAIKSIDQNMRSDNNWERFELYFDESHQDFIKKLKQKQPALTKSSISLCAFLKLDLSTKEIASLMNISVSGVEKRRHRLRKKLNLGTDTNLKEYLEAI